LPQSEAIRFGAQKVEETAAATFLIRKTNKLVSRAVFKTGGFSGRRFYTRSSPTGEKLFIEKRRYRISTFGELGEITFKGLETLKGKRWY